MVGGKKIDEDKVWIKTDTSGVTACMGSTSHSVVVCGGVVVYGAAVV